ALGDDAHRIADHGIFGDAALEERLAGLVAFDLAEHVDDANREVLAREPLAAFRLDRDLGDDADDECAFGADAEEFADGRADIVFAADRKSYVRLRPGDREHAPERIDRPQGVRFAVHVHLPAPPLVRLLIVQEYGQARDHPVNRVRRSFGKLTVADRQRRAVVKEPQCGAQFRRKEGFTNIVSGARSPDEAQQNPGSVLAPNCASLHAGYEAAFAASSRLILSVTSASTRAMCSAERSTSAFAARNASCPDSPSHTALTKARYSTFK